jgi:hypothetical protein
MLDRVRGDIGLRGNNLLTDADIIAWANEISDEIAERFRWYRTSTTANVVNGQKEYPLPAGCISLEEVWHDQLPMQRMQLADFETNYAYFRRQGVGRPIFYYLRGSGGYGLQPTPGTDITNGFLLIYTGTPPHPASGSDFYTVPYTGERCIISGAKLRAAEKDSSGEGARRYEMLLRVHNENMMALERAIETVADGDVTVLGQDIEPELGGWQRWMGFDPMRNSTPPPG